MAYLPYQQRVVDEAAELQTKTIALSNFINGEKFPEVEAFEAERLVIQMGAMTQYLNILKERIANFAEIVGNTAEVVVLDELSD